MSDPEPFPPELAAHPANRAVLGFLRDKSAHSDVAESFTRSLDPLGDVQVFCPDWKTYRCVVASTKGVVFGYAIGMQDVGFRVGPPRERALRTGAEAVSELGDDWAAFTLFRSDWPAVDLKFWALKSYRFTRDSFP